MSTKDPLSPALSDILRKWLHAPDFPEEHDPSAGHPWPDEIAAVVTAARELRRQAGADGTSLGPWVAIVLRDVVCRYLEEAARYWTDRELHRQPLVALLILEQYLVPLDRSQPQEKVIKYLQDEAHLCQEWGLDEETARWVREEAETVTSGKTYSRRRQAGIALLAQAVRQLAGSERRTRNVRALEWYADSRPAARLVPFPVQSPSLPDLHVARPTLEQAILDRLQRNQTLVLWGPGGAGKTTLAAWTARTLADRFSEASLWVESQPCAGVADMQDRVARSLEGSLTGHSLLERAGELRALLRNRHCLLVLDDVWATPDLVHLRVVNDASRLVITTRDAKVADLLGAPLLPVGGLSAEECLALLAQWAGCPVEEVAGRELVTRLGGLPLAVNLSGARLRAGDDLSDVLASLRQAQPDLSALDLDEAGARTESLTLCFDLSYQPLAAVDRQRFAQLGCFVGDFAEAAAAAVWEVDVGEAHQSLRHLARLALVEWEASRYRLHPLLRAYARQRLSDWPDVDGATRRRHAAWHIRYALYHPQVLDGVTEPAPDLDWSWPDVVAGVRWAADHSPRLAAWAALLAHAERPALLAAVGPALVDAVIAYLAEAAPGAEQAVFHELLADLCLLQGDLEAGVAHFGLAEALWQAAENWLASSRAGLRVAGAHLLQGDPAAAAAAARGAQGLLAKSLPLTPDDQAAAYWVFYWFGVIYNPLVRWAGLPEADVAALARLAQQTGQPLLAARGMHIHRLWCTTKETPRPAEAQARGRALAVEACRLWRAGGRPDRADDEVSFGNYELTGRYSRRAAARYARRRSQTTPAVSRDQIRSVSSEGIRWWLGATEDQRTGWLSRMLQRYLGVGGAPALPPGSRARRWAEDILCMGVLGDERRRLAWSGRPPSGQILNGPEWQALSGQQALPWVGQAAQLIVYYLDTLARDVN